MSQLLVVFGATGQQGGSVIRHVLEDPELSKRYKLRGITRDPNSESSQALTKQGVEVVACDVDKRSDVEGALEGAHTVFFMGAPRFGPGMKEHERDQTKAVADAAVAAGVQYFIFSTLPHVTKMSGGKYTKVGGFDSKAEAEEYIRTLPMKSAFFAPGSFMQNWQWMLPQPQDDGTYLITRHVASTAQLPLIDTPGDTGKFVGAILAEPDKYEGKTFCAATKLYNYDQIAEAIGNATGKTVKYKQVSEEEARKNLPPHADMLLEMMSYQQDFGYYGADTKDLVAWAVANARGKPSTFEEYLQAHPISLK